MIQVRTNMIDTIDSEELKTEEEIDESPFVEFDISVSPADPTLELLAVKMHNGDLIVPFYQRKFVWKIEQASKLIESFLMGLPVPQVFLYVNDEDLLEIIDGQQRITSVKYFFDGYFGEPDGSGKRQVFRLKGLSERSEYNGKTFAELEPRDQRRLKNTSLRAIHIKQLKPSLRNDSVFHIFERLNTGGTRLKPQEIRNAVYRGKITGELNELNGDKNWMKILGLKKQDKHQKDIELILRLFSLYKNWEQYEKPMLKYLNVQMGIFKNFDHEKCISFKEKFPFVAEIVANNIENPFRPNGVINTSMLEGIMVALLEADNLDDNKVKSFYERISNSAEFLSLVRGATTDTLIVQKRNRAARDMLNV